MTLEREIWLSAKPSPQFGVHHSPQARNQGVVYLASPSVLFGSLFSCPTLMMQLLGHFTSDTLGPTIHDDSPHKEQVFLFAA
jgi:hypothetical protein